TGWSDHAAQVVEIYQETTDNSENKNKVKYRQTNNINNINKFKNLLTQENWYDSLTNGDYYDVDLQFNEFMRVININFEATFPQKVKYTNNKITNNMWITQGIKKSSQHLKELFHLTKSGNLSIIEHYKEYKKIYKRVIQAAKKRHNNYLMQISKNKGLTA
ncbi:hypothetical protein, partial [Enterobacter cloacae complex sp. 2DZ2F20B]|uniref:hypothetical protein n=1 Tax=Enterobacter cloacae complex sp. 2DZ2F20B TaxID=2511993 RepID=UPI0010253094